jgi:hypothetical protein
MTEPIRHSASSRNRRKALHHIRNIKEEALNIYAAKVALDEKLERLIQTICKVENRLEAESKR